MLIAREKVKTTLARIVSSAVTEFSHRHQGEEFYGFALDCKADYYEVLLCLNTEEDLQQRATRLKGDPPKRITPKFDKMMEEKYGIKPKPSFHDQTVPEIVERLRWETGDWKYQGFFNCSGHPTWAVLAAELSREDEGEPDREMFMETVCGVIPEIQIALESLNRTRDFRVFVVDHDESIETAWSRLRRVQAQTET